MSCLSISLGATAGRPPASSRAGYLARFGRGRAWLVAAALALQAGASATAGAADAAPAHGASEVAPHLFWVLPFAALLLSIAVLPLVHATHHWWERNSSKLTVALALAAVTCAYYLLRAHGFHAEPGAASLLQVLRHAVLSDYVPFMVLLFSLYTIGGGIHVSGDIPAHPLTNAVILLIGALLASLIGTTGAAMLLVRPLLQVNSERHRVAHTVVFFIFLVCNIGGCLLPIGDPPLFLGYLRGVPFLWTTRLVAEWAVCTALVLAVYIVWDTMEFRRESRRDREREDRVRVPFRVSGKRNLWLLGGVVLAVGVLVPGRPLPVLGHRVPDVYIREIVQLALAGLSLWLTPWGVRRMNNFNFTAIAEVAALFIGIFITMQVPIEYLSIRGAELHLTHAWQYFWASGLLSSVLDNAPTYVVYFSAAGALPVAPGVDVLHGLETATGSIAVPLLKAISCGSVFMGAMTYIGNGPNFMVKSIAEQSGVKMPSFFGYMAYSAAVLLPVFAIVTWLFF